MKAPNKIYVPMHNVEAETISQLNEYIVEGSVEYIRKDFLLEWAIDRIMPEYSAEGKGWNWALRTLIDKLNSHD